jgi:hypothetical protein
MNPTPTIEIIRKALATPMPIVITTQKDWVDFAFVVVSALAGLFGVWWGTKEANKSNRKIRYSDLIIAGSKETYKSILPLLDQMTMIMRLIQMEAPIGEGGTKQGFEFIWNNQLNDLLEVFREEMEKFRVLNHSSLVYQSDDLNVLIQFFHLTIENTLRDKSGNKKITVQDKEKLLTDLGRIWPWAMNFLELETNKKALDALKSNDMDEFERLMEANVQKLRDAKETAKPFLKMAKDVVYKRVGLKVSFDGKLD